MSSVKVYEQTADCLHQRRKGKHRACTQWEAGTGMGPLVVIACSSSNVGLAGSGCRGWMRGWQSSSQPVVVRWLTSLGHLHFLWPLSLGGKNSLVKIMVSFWLITFEQEETNLATAKQREGPKTLWETSEKNICSVFFLSFLQ